jgi:hypothetical protein
MISHAVFAVSFLLFVNNRNGKKQASNTLEVCVGSRFAAMKWEARKARWARMRAREGEVDRVCIMAAMYNMEDAMRIGVMTAGWA